MDKVQAKTATSKRYAGKQFARVDDIKRPYNDWIAVWAINNRVPLFHINLSAHPLEGKQHCVLYAHYLQWYDVAIGEIVVWEQRTKGSGV